MKGLITNLIILLFPLIIFIIAFYISAGLLSREISVVDISSKIHSIINEAEIYKIPLRDYVRERMRNSNNTNINRNLVFETFYSLFKISIIEANRNKIRYEVFVEPKERISSIELIIHFIDEVEL